MMHDCNSNNNRFPRASKANPKRPPQQQQPPLWSSPLSVMDSHEGMQQHQDSFHLDYWEEENTANSDNSEEDLEVGSSVDQQPHRTRFLSQPEGWQDEQDDEAQEFAWNSHHYLPATNNNNSPRRRLYYHNHNHNHNNNTIQSNRQRAQSEPDARQVFPIRRNHPKRRLWQEPAPTASIASTSSITTEPLVLAAPPPPLPPQHSTAHTHQSPQQQQQPQSSEGPPQSPPSQQPAPSPQQQQQAPAHPHHSSLLVLPGGSDNNNNNNNNSSNLYPTLSDRERRARVRWVRINRRFQLVITIVALLFSLLLFAILISWVVLTSAYVVSFDKSCDVPLKPYFWLVTLQLVLDVFRSDIMRWVFHWDANSNQRIPCRVIVYNMAYLLYAMLVLRLGINAVFVQQATCSETAPELYNASAAFISLSMAAWATIVGGYLLPFCVVAALLTCNGYNPSNMASSSSSSSPHPQNTTNTTQAVPVFPAAYSNTGAPSHCIELLPIVTPVPHQECCICMEEFTRRSAVVETTCKHVFHQQCCREWLLQARTCPVCRTDIAASLEQQQQQSSSLQQQQGTMEPTPPPPLIPLGPTGRPVVGLLRMLHRPENQALMRSRTSSGGNGNTNANGNSSTHSTNEAHTHTTTEAPLRARSSSVNMPDASPPGM